MAQIKKLKQGETTIFPMTDASAVQYAGKTLSEMTGGGVYSTQPVKIGTWINGETIYREIKEIDFAQIDKTADHFSSNISDFGISITKTGGLLNLYIISFAFPLDSATNQEIGFVYTPNEFLKGIKDGSITKTLFIEPIYAIITYVSLD